MCVCRWLGLPAQGLINYSRYIRGHEIVCGLNFRLSYRVILNIAFCFLFQVCWLLFESTGSFIRWLVGEYLKLQKLFIYSAVLSTTNLKKFNRQRLILRNNISTIDISNHKATFSSDSYP